MPARAHFTLDSGGYFAAGGKRIVPVGVNYWPASCGVEMWRAWPEREIRRDFELVRSLGLNCVRFFLRWEDFEPRPGQYRRIAFTRLARLLEWCKEYELLAHPSLFVGWMSGGIFWPEWKGEKNLFSDAGLRRRAFAFAAKAAQVCARFPQTVLAVDQGNELCCLPDGRAAPPADVASWCAGVNAAVRRSFPTALLISGNEQAQVIADTGWRFGAQPGCDLYSMHTYPNSAWHSLQFDGMTDPLGQSLLPFYIRCARAFGPVFAQEFGTLFTSGQCADSYLRAVLPACWKAGANGFLWWCLRDITASGHPYDKNAFEGTMGLVDAEDDPKPTLRFFLDFAASLAARPAPVSTADEIGLYWPRHYYHRDDPANPGNEPRALSRQMIVAHYALTSLGYRVAIVRGDQPLPAAGGRTLVIASALLTATEVEALSAWVARGGNVIWHGLEAKTWGPGTSRLVGAEPTDFLRPHAGGVKAFGSKWDFHCFAGGVRPGVVCTSAAVVAADARQRPLILRNRFESGTVIACLALVDEEFARQVEQGAGRKKLLAWYRGILDCSARIP